MLSRALLEIGKPTTYQGSVLRIVETQEYAATTKLVESLDEQHLLEELLDEVKPPYKENTQQLHYLISTPFRYPPLLHGSRFGGVLMPSYFYGSEKVETMLTECAYYRFIFLDDMTVPYTKTVNSEHMSFSVNVNSSAMADLTKISSPDIIDSLMSPYHYQFSQTLGKILTQEKSYDLIRYFSARDKNNGVNVALTSPDQITSTQPEKCTNWICQTTTNQVSFNSPHIKPLSFHLDDFFVNGQLPRPA